MYKQVSLCEAEVLLSQKNVTVADVRDKESFDEDHIPNAIHLSVIKLQDFCDHHDKEKPLLLYCYHGISSQSVAQHLVDQGFMSVYSLIGGFEGWKSHQPNDDVA